MPKIRSAAFSDVGHLRSQNEDRYVQDDVAAVYGVADGVGGLPGGEEAAQAAVDEVLRATQQLKGDGRPNLDEIVQWVNRLVAELGQKVSPNQGIGTTLTFGVVRADTLHLAHVGDSRCYVWANGAIELLTRDHSVESDARVRRAKGEVVYYHQANRNALTRCIGQPTPLEVDQSSRPVKPGERYLFCTDGVTRLIRESEIAETLAKNIAPEAMARELVDLANRRGGPDNSTAVVLSIE